MSPTLAGFTVLALTAGLVEAIKTQFGVSGKWVFLLAVVVGVLLSLLAYAITLVPNLAPWVEYAVYGLVAALSVTGYYDLGHKPNSPQ